MAHHSPYSRTLPAIEQALRRSLEAMQNAEDENAAATAYASLKSDLEDFLRKSAELRSEYFKMKNTVASQAHTIAGIELSTLVGEQAPEEPKAPHVAPDWPETLTVQNAPDFFFIRLSYGFVNIRHIVELDVKSKTLHTVNAIRHLSAGDVRTLLFHLKMYRP